MEKFKKGLQIDNGESKVYGDLEESEAYAISFEIFWFVCQSALQSSYLFMWLFSLMTPPR